MVVQTCLIPFNFFRWKHFLESQKSSLSSFSVTLNRLMTNTSNMLFVHFNHSLSLSKVGDTFSFFTYHRCLHFIHFFRYFAPYIGRLFLFSLYDAFSHRLLQKAKKKSVHHDVRHEMLNYICSRDSLKGSLQQTCNLSYFEEKLRWHGKKFANCLGHDKLP